uniref:Tumor necrosis factor receptor superfamily, member 1B n=1 Tax=Cyprinus carpio TaxID=7962 RepID=A0A8C2II42_CYPCA
VTDILTFSPLFSQTPYRSDGSCDTAFEYYAKDLGLCCSRCKPGTHLSDICTSTSDTICGPCQDGQYSENMNHFPNCFSCPKCKDVKGLMYHTKCSADTKAVCVCKPGMICSKRNFNNECEECRKYRSCKPGEYVIKEGSTSSDVRCRSCPPGTFSNRSNTEQCKPHTQCEGRSVLRPGDSTVDTLCEMKPPSTAQTTTTKAPLQSSPKPTHPIEPRNLRGEIQEMQPMNTTTLSLAPSSRVTSSTVERDASVSSTPDHQRLLPVDRCQKEPSMTSSDSQSQPDSSQSSADWLERTSQESIPEQPSVSSPMVNLSITFNCQVNPTTASCSIPLNTSARTPHVEAPVPLSQEEVCISCQQEDGKEALRSVQESGLCVF